MPHRLITETWPRVQEAYSMLPYHISGVLQGTGVTLQNLQNLEQNLQELQTLANIPPNQRDQQQQQRFQELQNILGPYIEAHASIGTLEENFYAELDRRVRDPTLLNLYKGLKEVEVRPHRFYVGNRRIFLPQLIRELLQQLQTNVDGWALQQLPFEQENFHYTLYTATPQDNDILFAQLWYQFTNQHAGFADRLTPNTYRGRREGGSEMICIETGNGNLTITRYGLRVRPIYLLQTPLVHENEITNRRSFFDQVADEIYGIREVQEEQQPQKRFWKFWK